MNNAYDNFFNDDYLELISNFCTHVIFIFYRRFSLHGKLDLTAAECTTALNDCFQHCLSLKQYKLIASFTDFELDIIYLMIVNVLRGASDGSY